MSEVIDAESHAGTALTVIKTALPTILAADQNDILGKLAAKVRAHKPDISTAKGRDEIRSLAAEIASLKVTLVKLGKSLTEGWRKQTKAVNDECSVIEEKMDALKAQVRQPLTDFENREKDRVAAHEAALARLAVHPDMERATSEELAQAIRARLEPEAQNWQEFHERALKANADAITILSRWRSAAEDREAEAAELARLRAEEAERRRLAEIEAQRIRDERIAAEAAERARLAAEAEAARKAEEAAAAAKRAHEAAEARAQAEVLAAERAARESWEAAARAQAAAAKAEADRIAAEERAERERQEAAAAAERRQAAAIEAERKRAADEKAAEEAAAAARAANVAHKRRINGEALADLTALGLSDDRGKAVVVALANGTIRNCRIEY